MQKLVASIKEEKSFYPPMSSPMSSPIKVYDYLYLGSRMEARNITKLKAMGISSIIDCAKEYREILNRKNTLTSFPLKKEEKKKEEELASLKTLHLDLYDDERIISQFRREAEKAVQFIKECAEKKEKVLVCCHLGTSRAAGIVLAYMMRKEDTDYSFALGKLRNLCVGTNQVILPNRWIEDILEMWE